MSWQKAVADYLVPWLAAHGEGASHAQTLARDPGAAFIVSGQDFTTVEAFFEENPEYNLKWGLSSTRQRSPHPTLQFDEDVIEEFLLRTYPETGRGMPLFAFEWHGTAKYVPDREAKEIVFDGALYLAGRLGGGRLRRLYEDTFANPFICLGIKKELKFGENPQNDIAFVLSEVLDEDAYLLILP